MNIVKATEPGSWGSHWQKLIEHLNSVISQTSNVIVSADQGLYADWLYQLIVYVGWHPLLRINYQDTFRVPPQTKWRSLSSVIATPGQSWSGLVVWFKTNLLECTLLAR